MTNWLILSSRFPLLGLSTRFSAQGSAIVVLKQSLSLTASHYFVI